MIIKLNDVKDAFNLGQPLIEYLINRYRYYNRLNIFINCLHNDFISVLSCNLISLIASEE